MCVSVCECVCVCCECTFLLSLQFCGSGGVSEEKQTVSRDQSSRMYGCRIPGTHIHVHTHTHTHTPQFHLLPPAPAEGSTGHRILLLTLLWGHQRGRVCAGPQQEDQDNSSGHNLTLWWRKF